MTAAVRGRRRGAPKKAPGEARTVVITLRLTPAEFAKLQVEAANEGKTRALGRYLFQRALGRQPKIMPAINRELWSHLGRWAGAFTTIANAAAGERLAELYPHLNPSLSILLQRARAELSALRLALLGLDEESMAAADEAERLGILTEDYEDADVVGDEEHDPDTIDPDAPMDWFEE